MPLRDEVEGARQRERKRKKREIEKRTSGRANETRTDERAAQDATNRRRTTRLGLCRRRRDSTERAGVPQTGRRLSGMQALLPPLPRFPSVGRAVGPGPSALPPSRAPPSRSFLSRTELPYGPPWYRATSTSTTTIANYGTQAQVRARAQASERSGAGIRRVRVWETRRASVYTCVYAPVDDATSRPLMAISAAGHQRVPTGPNRPGQLAASVTFARARVPLTCLSLFLFFLIFLPLLLRATPSRGAQRPFLFVSSFFFFFSFPRRSFFPPAPLCTRPRCFVKIMLRARERYFNTFGNQYGIFLDNVRIRRESLKCRFIKFKTRCLSREKYTRTAR